MKVARVVIVLLLTLTTEIWAQTTAIITPRGYNASLNSEASITFQCDVTGAVGVDWRVDGIPSDREENVRRGITATPAFIVDQVTGSFRSNLSIPRSDTDRTATILCTADSIALNEPDVPSDPVLFQVQGLLDPPPNLALSEVSDQFMRTLSWDEPFSLDITGVDPDVNHYQVCYNISAEVSQCMRVNQTEFTFVNVRVPLLFTVSAVNVVGEGNATSALHQANSCKGTQGMACFHEVHASIRD